MLNIYQYLCPFVLNICLPLLSYILHYDPVYTTVIFLLIHLLFVSTLIKTYQTELR